MRFDEVQNRPSLKVQRHDFLILFKDSARGKNVLNCNIFRMCQSLWTYKHYIGRDDFLCNEEFPHRGFFQIHFRWNFWYYLYFDLARHLSMFWMYSFSSVIQSMNFTVVQFAVHFCHEQFAKRSWRWWIWQWTDERSYFLYLVKMLSKFLYFRPTDHRDRSGTIVDTLKLMIRLLRHKFIGLSAITKLQA